MTDPVFVTPPTGVVVRDDGAGCRVYAARSFAEGETIERAPVVELTSVERARLADTTLGGFVLSWGADATGGAVALGYGAVYRASSQPNATHAIHPEHRVLEILAARTIERGEEIAVADNGDRRPPIPAAPGTVITPPADVRWGDTEGAGFGVFAARDLQAGETIERTPCITFGEAEWKPVEQTILDHYGFLWGEDLQAGALPLGYGAVYNHSFEPNATYVRRLAAATMDFVAIRDVASGAEIRTNYNRDPLDRSPVWFEVAPYAVQ
jgi:hypothetical protein